MKKRFVFAIDVEGSAEDLQAFENRLNVVFAREIMSAESLGFANVESKAIELTEPVQGIHPISPSVDYQNFILDSKSDSQAE